MTDSNEGSADRVQVLIAGGGPVGLTLAIALGRLGVRCSLVDEKPAPAGWPKMERCNARTMEIYRRLGLAPAIRAAGLRADSPYDSFVVTRLSEPAVLRMAYPSVEECQARIAFCDDGSLPLEPYQVISQYTLEPLLKAHAERMAGVEVRFGYRLEDFVQDNAGVEATVITPSGALETIRADYLVGCDGGTSTVRKRLGVSLQGKANLGTRIQALIRCDDLYDRILAGRGRHYNVLDDLQSIVVVQDDCRHFGFHMQYAEDVDVAALFRDAIGIPLEFEVLYVGDWRQHLMVAERYRDRRVFLCGDSAHLVIPTGGLGMNTGIGDADNLAWKLAADLAGWGGPALLESYEPERRSIGLQNVEASGFAAAGIGAWRALCKPGARDDTPEGRKLREEIAAVANVEHRKNHEMVGVELGYRYDRSPVICPTAEPLAAMDRFRYVPLVAPGARLPHMWRAEGTALHDALGQEFVLLVLDEAPDSTAAKAFLDAFSTVGAPASVLHAPEPRLREVYGHRLVLVRPDLHIVWCGDNLPDMTSMAEFATGKRQIRWQTLALRSEHEQDLGHCQGAVCIPKVGG